MSEILIRPLVTEKMTSIQDRQGKFGFVVKQSANKIEIKKAIEKTYGVNVIQINTIRYDGKLKHRYTKAGVVSGRSAGYKKAIVKLAAGETIDFYSNI
ncbi:MAG: 50S ribosomal protein L23 [Bacteroidota bacterium]|jgi:large subunit ribosomal protein L23|nr:50S ribosomal protein L23 [Bacteroidota bacterium]